jgi:hypothetical protein
LVVKLSVACVVPAASVPDGDPFVRSGGVVSDGPPPSGVFISVWISVWVRARL